MLNWLKFHHIIHDTTASMHQPVTLYSQKNDILRSWLIACCKVAPTLVRQIWRHNYVISCNEYLIYTLSESTFPWVYSLKFYFCLNPHITHGDMKENVSGCFFSEHSVVIYCIFSMQSSFPVWTTVKARTKSEALILTKNLDLKHLSAIAELGTWWLHNR